jgi:ABC-type branched-subunit amino acid transport system substrate-binding protein
MPRRSTATRLAFAVVAASVLLAGCGGRGKAGSTSGSGSDAPGITDDTITIGSSYPLSGPLGANGIAAKGAAVAYFDSVNAAGGVKMADGKTRKIKFVFYDDGYDPAKAVQNYGKLVDSDHVFALFQTFGTAPNLAIMKKANADKVPQVFVHAGDALFSMDRAANPWTMGWQPTYESEGVAYGKSLASQNKPMAVAVLRQADTLGEVFLKGMQEGIAGSKVTIAKVATYTPKDPTVDSQISTLAATKADALFMAVAIPPLMISGINHAVTLGWKPTVFMASMSSSISQVVDPGHLGSYPDLYTASFVKAPDDPQWANDQAVSDLKSQMKKSSPDANPNITNAQWGYGAATSLVDALKGMKTVSRQGLMDAVHALKSDGGGILLPGITMDGSDSQSTPLHGIKVEHFAKGSWQIQK